MSRDLHRLPERLIDPEVVDVRDEPVVWAGGMLRHYGHFLIDSAARLWPLLPGAELEGLPVVFTTPLEVPLASEWLDAFGARTVELPEQGVVRFRRMYVPQPAWQIGGWAAPELRQVHLHMRESLLVRKSPRCGVLWLSRSLLSPRRVAYDECLLEWILAEHVRIIHPETMSLAAQVGELEACEAVVGVIGSAFHGLLMVPRPPECVYLCPSFEVAQNGGDPTRPVNVMRADYVAQDEILGGSAEFVRALEDTGASADRLLSGERVHFPAGHRLLVPGVLTALSETVLPGLMEDPRAAALAHPESARSRRAEASALERAAARMLREPLSVEARRALGRAFEAEGLTHCAREQQMTVADLTGELRLPG